MLELLKTTTQLLRGAISKPFANEHAARIISPEKFKRFARQNDKGGKGIDFIFGIMDDGKTELQTIRFDSQIFTETEAKTWLKEHDIKSMSFEGAKK